MTEPLSPQPPFEEEPWEQQVTLALRALPPVEPPEGFLDGFGDELAARRSRGARRSTRPLLVAAAAVLVVAGLAGATRLFLDRSNTFEVNELVARHDDLASETASGQFADTSVVPSELVERAVRAGQLPDGWRQEAFLREGEVISLFIAADASAMTASDIEAGFGAGQPVGEGMMLWPVPGQEPADPASLIATDTNGLIVVVGLDDVTAEGIEADLSGSSATDQPSDLVAALREALEAEGFQPAGG
jgi:hypothetical protein